MAKTSPIGDINQMYLKTQDQLTNEYQTLITSKKINCNPLSTYQQVDSAMRKLNGLSTNTYEDTLLITAISVNFEVDDE